MARITSNDLIDGLSGRLGDSLVFRTIRGKTFVTTPARKPNKKKESEAQRNTRTRFREASEWAQYILLYPEKKAYYQKRAKALNLPNAYTAAITDYMRKPKVEKTRQGDTITVDITKPGFSVPEVRVTPNESSETPANVVVRQHNNGWRIRYTMGTVPQLIFIIMESSGATMAISIDED